MQFYLNGFSIWKIITYASFRDSIAQSLIISFLMNENACGTVMLENNRVFELPVPSFSSYKYIDNIPFMQFFLKYPEGLEMPL